MEMLCLDVDFRGFRRKIKSAKNGQRALSGCSRGDPSNSLSALSAAEMEIATDP